MRQEDSMLRNFRVEISDQIYDQIKTVSYSLNQIKYKTNNQSTILGSKGWGWWDEEGRLNRAEEFIKDSTSNGKQINNIIFVYCIW